jgi:hypothetical protein
MQMGKGGRRPAPLEGELDPPDTPLQTNGGPGRETNRRTDERHWRQGRVMHHLRVASRLMNDFTAVCHTRA